LIVVSDLVHQYRTPQGVTDALKGVNLTIDQREFLAIFFLVILVKTCLFVQASLVFFLIIYFISRIQTFFRKNIITQLEKHKY